MTTFTNNPYAPGVVHDSFVTDQLIAGEFQLETQPIIIAAGALKRGAVLGLISAQGITAQAVAGNTGNGTVGALARTAGSKEGVYVLTATDPTHFNVVDPEGAALPAATVGAAYNQQGLQFQIAAGGTAYVAGDKINLNSFDATGQYIACVKTATDGSQVPTAILVDDADATGGPIAAGAYLTGEFNARRIIIDPSWSIALVRDALRARSIFVKASVTADPPT